MNNKVLKRIIVGAISFSLVMNMALLCSCNSTKNYEEEIANLQKQIDELKEQNEKLAEEHKMIMEKLGIDIDEGGEDETTDSTTSITERPRGSSN